MSVSNEGIAYGQLLRYEPNPDAGLSNIQTVDGLSTGLNMNVPSSPNAGAFWLGAGTSSSPRQAVTNAGVAAAGNFLQIYGAQTATGATRAIYARLYGNIAGASGDALRAFGTVNNVAADTYRGAQISLSFGTTGSITGLGTALTATLQLPNSVLPANGTYAAVNAELFSDGSTTAVSAVTELALFRGVLNGNATGVGRVDDKAYLIALDGATIGSGNILEASTTEANYAYSARCLIGGTVAYLMFASAAG